MLHKFRESLPVILLLAIALIICVTNYTSGSFLSGWDTLHPEFNFGLAFERTINGVFRTEQGLGAVAAHSHMADLPRITILWIAHFVLPLSFLRFFYIDLCIIFGTLGMYFFLKRVVLKNNSPSFLGSFFYLLNIGTVQTFNVPFEMFTTLFATLPWLFLFATLYISEKNKRPFYLLLFAVTTLLNTPSAYAATLWYVFFLCFGVYFLIFALLNNRHDHHSIRHFFILVAITLVINCFWLIPNLYFVIMHGPEVAKANINLLFSDQAFLKNKEFGNIWDILLLKVFYFDWKIYAGNNQFVDLLSPFINHFQNVFVNLVAYLLAGGFIAGAVIYVRRVKTFALPSLAVLLICLFFLFNDNFPVSLIYNLFQNHIPFFKEALRFPDDKILNIYVFLVSVFFGVFAQFAIEKIAKFNRRYHYDKLFVLVVALMIVYYSLPSFNGNFINYFLRVNIPKSYFQLFAYLDKQPANLRVANLPIESPWGWVYYDWGRGPSYQGAGFIYFGIKQPLLDRDFDRWSPYNESYYREMSYAIYKQDSKLLTNVITKYKIGFVMVDKSVINPQNSPSTLYFEQSEQLLSQTGLVSQKQTFGNIDIYSLNTQTQAISAVKTNININPKTTSTYQDFAYQKFGNYFTANNSNNFSNVLYPFRDLINNQSKLTAKFLIGDTNLSISPLYSNLVFQTPALSESFNTIPVTLLANKTNNQLTLSFNPSLPKFDTTSLGKPLTKKLDLSSYANDELSLTVNASNLVDLNLLVPNTQTAIANLNLINGTNTISIFDKQNIVSVPGAKDVISPFFSSCSENSIPPTAGVLSNGLKLNGKGDICILIPYGFLPKIQGQSLILTGFEFNFIGTANISSCLYNAQTNTCVSYKNPLVSGNTMSFIYPLAVKDIQKLELEIFIKPNDQSQNTYLLSDINSWYTKPVSGITLSKDDISQMFVNTSNLSFSELSVPKNSLDNTSFTQNFTKSTNDCKTANAKKEIVEQNGSKIIKYTSVLGSFCDHFSYPNLPHDQGYLVIVNSKNQAGLPLNLCLADYTSKRCDIYANLSSFTNFDNDTFLLPPMDEAGSGYDLDFENLGVKGSQSINYLSSIEIVPLPYPYIENINSQNITRDQFEGSIVSFKQYLPWLYLVKASTKPTIITLNQSFEPGFKAYNIACSSNIACAVKSLFAPFYKAPIDNHVLIDNWANGWIVYPITNPNQAIVIVFVPQYFEIVGFLLLLLVFLLLFYHCKPTKKH